MLESSVLSGESAMEVGCAGGKGLVVTGFPCDSLSVFHMQQQLYKWAEDAADKACILVNNVPTVQNECLMLLVVMFLMSTTTIDLKEKSDEKSNYFFHGFFHVLHCNPAKCYSVSIYHLFM